LKAVQVASSLGWLVDGAWEVVSTAGLATAAAGLKMKATIWDRLYS